MSQIDLANLTPEMIEQLQAVLGTTGGVKRSPAWKPLKNLNPPNTPKGRLNRPHFEWSANDDESATVIPPYPRLYWDGKGKEQLVGSADQVIPTDWTDCPPLARPLDAMAKAQSEFDALSPDDQVFVLNAQKQTRLNRIHDLMAGLSEADLASFTASQKMAEPKKEKKSA